MLNRFETFIRCITEIDLYWHRLASSEMKEYGLKGNCAIYFAQLCHAPEGLTPVQLGTACGRDKADVSRDMATLEKAGLVTRVRSGGGTYRARIRLTERGRALTDEIIRKVEQAVCMVGGDLTDAERECFYSVLGRITDRLHTVSESGLTREQ